MGIYLNPGNKKFQLSLNSEIYMDKSMLIAGTNAVLNTSNRFLCVSRPRRFGKSVTADMLTAYYSRECKSMEQFQKLKISEIDSFEKHLNQYNVLQLNMADFWTDAENVTEMIQFIKEDLMDELQMTYPDIKMPQRNTLSKALETIFTISGIPFVFIIDEWDCIFRENSSDKESQKFYLDFLRNLLKDKVYVALAYMTGILPIKKYGKHSALNMFTEISMTDPMQYAEYTGFTEEEIKNLCKQYQMSFEEVKRWYNGYDVAGFSIYNPRSVVMSMISKNFNNYWTSTETYEALQVYIEMNFDGLRDTIIKLLAGESQMVDTTTFANDMVTFQTKDDILTLLIHLGYLTYHHKDKTVTIPNAEVSEQFASVIKLMGWKEVADSLKKSDELLEATLAENAEKTAALLEKAHEENSSILKYNDENTLSCIISIAYYSARKNYDIYRELPAGKGFADLVFIPRRNTSLPAIIVELKYDQNAVTALQQIKNKNYTEGLKSYTGEIFLVGVNYDKKKHHTCVIEKVKKDC